MFFETYNLNQSLNFSGKNLEGTDFSGSDIRGFNFTGANLTDADFSNTKAGLKKHWIVITFLFSLITGFMIGGIAAFMGSFLCSQNTNEQIAGAIALIGCIIFSAISVREGFANAFVKVVTILASIGIFVGSSSVFLNNLVTANIAVYTATSFSLSTFVVIIITACLTFIIAANSAKILTCSLISAIFLAISIPLLAESKIASDIAQRGLLGFTITIGITLLVMLLCTNISRGILAGGENHSFIRKIAIATAGIGGTSFRGANLTAANFTEAILKNTDFSKADLTHTIWHEAKKLELTKLDNTILDNPAVRDLLVNQNSKNNSYENASLEGAYLVDLDLRYVNFQKANLSKANLKGANLSNADFTEANLTQTNLTGACLEQCILTQTQAIRTDFTQAYFTGAYGLESWNIDGTTKLDGVNCRFVYLGGKPKQGEESERCPQSGEFAPSEFTKFFQVVINTVDLIFRDGVNLTALVNAIETVRAANQNTPLELQNIESKGHGFVVVKVSVSKEVDKAKIHSELKQSYEEQLRTVEAKYQAKLKAKQKKIEKIQEILAEEDSREYQIQVQVDKLVVLIIGEGDFTNGFPVTAQIWTNDHLCSKEIPTNSATIEQIRMLKIKLGKRFLIR